MPHERRKSTMNNVVLRRRIRGGGVNMSTLRTMFRGPKIDCNYCRSKEIRSSVCPLMRPYRKVGDFRRRDPLHNSKEIGKVSNNGTAASSADVLCIVYLSVSTLHCRARGWERLLQEADANFVPSGLRAQSFHRGFPLIKLPPWRA